MPDIRDMSPADILPPEPDVEPALDPPGAPLHVAVAPGLLEQEHVVIREPGDTDEDYEARQELFAAVLGYARRG